MLLCPSLPRKISSGKNLDSNLDEPQDFSDSDDKQKGAQLVDGFKP
jgi:hypothetical protein